MFNNDIDRETAEMFHEHFRQRFMRVMRAAIDGNLSEDNEDLAEKIMVQLTESSVRAFRFRKRYKINRDFCLRFLQAMKLHIHSEKQPMFDIDEDRLLLLLGDDNDGLTNTERIHR